MLMFCVGVVPVFGEMDELRELKKVRAIEDAQRSLLSACRWILIALPWMFGLKGARIEGCAVASVSAFGDASIGKMIADAGLS